MIYSAIAFHFNNNENEVTENENKTEKRLIATN
jgi:hypothetical protein